MGDRKARRSGTHTITSKPLNWSSSISELQYPGSVTHRDSGQWSSVWLAMCSGEASIAGALSLVLQTRSRRRVP